MPIVAECPSCGKKLKIPDGLIGKTVRCSDCASTFLAAKAPPAPPPPPAPAPAGDEFDEQPVRREPLPGYQQPRNGMLLTFGILSISFAVVAGLTDTAAVGFSACLVCCPVLPVSWVIALFAAVFSLIGLAMGIMAWIMGSADLKKMAVGSIDPAGRGGTKGGMICGIVGTALNAIALLLSCIGIIAVLALGAAFFASIPAQATFNRPPVGPQRPGRISTSAVLKLSEYLAGRPGRL